MNTGDIFLSPRVSLNPQFKTKSTRPSSKLTSISRHTRFNIPTPPRNFPNRPLSHRSFTISCNAGGDDFITRVLTENPTQVEPRYLVGEKLLTLKEKERLASKDSNFRSFRIPRTVLEKLGAEREGSEGDGRGENVYLKDLLRKFKGKLYVPEEAFRVNLSEEEEFDRNLEELPRMGYEEFVTAMEKDKVKMLTSKAVVEGLGGEYGYKDFVVELKEIPGDKSLQRRKWAMKLDEIQASDVLEQYTGPQYEIESHASTSYVGKLPRHPHPVASSISSRMMVELGMLTALMVTAAAVVGGFLASAVFAVTSFVFFVIVYVAWPLAKPILRFAYNLSFGTIERIWDNLYDAFVDRAILTKISNFFTFGGSSDSVRLMTTIMVIFVTMVVLIRFTLSRRPKNFKTWDIWQGIQFGQSKANARVDGSTGVSFGDVAGIEEAVDELQELVRYLKNPELFDKMGIKPPHGVLLAGPPGCGKTLVAKAIAGEAGVPFYQMAGSEFVEVLVGVGSARIRDLFKRAKVNKPSVIFIDEIDALATRRQGIFSESTNYLYNAATQERETTLNQLLIELDGFDTGKGVIFLGATNRMDLLDPALLRPGRFDRKIRIRPPGTKGRLDILKVHARKVKMSPTVDLSSYAQNLPGWSGAKLAQLLQESALVAVRRGHKSILQSDIDDAVDRLTVGPKCLAIELGHQGQCRRATTEVGTAIVSHLLRRHENAKVELCQRISITPRGQTLSQIVFRRMDDESYVFERRPQLLHRLQVLLGGRAAEEVIYGRDTSRASVTYLADASWLARKILTIWNLEEPMTIHGEPPPWRKSLSFVGPKLDFEGSLYDDYGFTEPPINFNMDDEVVQRTEKLISEMYERVSSLLRRHHAALLKTVKVLLDNKEITGEQLEHILDKYPAETPIQLLLEEDNPGSLPIYEVEQGRELELSELTPSNGNFIS